MTHFDKLLIHLKLEAYEISSIKIIIEKYIGMAKWMCLVSHLLHSIISSLTAWRILHISHANIYIWFKMEDRDRNSMWVVHFLFNVPVLLTTWTHFLPIYNIPKVRVVDIFLPSNVKLLFSNFFRFLLFKKVSPADCLLRTIHSLLWTLVECIRHMLEYCAMQADVPIDW